MSQILITGKPPSTAPNRVANFLHVENLRDASFTTYEFAAYFLLTSREAHNVLNDYASEGLLTYAGMKEDAESWALSREGQAVFAYPSPGRFTKKNLSEITAALTPLAEEVVGPQVLEVSIGGRPAFGASNGRLLIGVRLAHEPFSLDADGELYQRIWDVGSRATSSKSGFSIMFFSDRVPKRLQKRVLVSGPRTVVHTEESNVDETEILQQRYLQRYVTGLGLGDLSETSRRIFLYGRDVRISSHLFWHLEREFELFKTPVLCELSPVTLTCDPAELLASPEMEEGAGRLHSHFERESWRRGRDIRRDRSLAQIDYIVATGGLEKQCHHPDWGLLRRLDLHFFNGHPEWLQERLLAGLRVWYGDIEKAREHQEAVVAQKRPAKIEYAAAFDVLNFDPPRLAGFIRQPSSNEASIKRLAKYWELELQHGPDCGGKRTIAHGFDGASLSLTLRPASQGEIEAFSSISKECGQVLSCIVFSGGLSLAVGRGRLSFGGKQVQVPDVLAYARLDGPALPKLLRGRDWFNDRHETIFSVIESFPQRMREIASSLVIDIEKLQMEDFAAKASVSPCVDPVVLATGLLSAWQFSRHENGWNARINGTGWAVVLDASHRKLTLTTHIEGHSHAYLISAPSRSKTSQPYKGKLGSLLPFMGRLWQVQDLEFDELLEDPAGEPARGEVATDGKLAAFDKFVEGALTGWGWGLRHFIMNTDGTTWLFIRMSNEFDV